MTDEEFREWRKRNCVGCGRPLEAAGEGDGEPFTAEWFAAAFASGDCCHFSTGWVSPGRHLEIISIRDATGVFRKTVVPPGSTRGDVRRFLAWQGVPAREGVKADE